MDRRLRGDCRSAEKVYTIPSWNWPIPTFTFHTRFGWEKKNGESVLSLYTQEDRGTVVTHLLLLVYCYLTVQCQEEPRYAGRIMSPRERSVN